MSTKHETELFIKLFQITERTSQNWTRFGPPKYALERLSLHHGDHPDWPHFKIREGFIITPSGESVTAKEIETFHWLMRELRYQWDMNNELQDKLYHRGKFAIACNDESHIVQIPDKFIS